MSQTLKIASADTATAVAPQRPPLVTPMHGGGKIFRGGVRGHRGGGGRPADRVRRALIGLAGAGVAQVLKPMIEGRPVRVLGSDGTLVEIDPSPTDRLRALELALKYGLGTADKVNVDAAFDAPGRIEKVRPVLILPELGSDWSGTELAPAAQRGLGG